MIGISADFDPLHNGHIKLIEKARELADQRGDKVVIYLNKGFSANHAPFFASYEARSRMALEAGADQVVPIEGLHHRLTLSYTVPIRIAMMIEEGVIDYVDAADVSTSRIKKYAASFARNGIFSGIPRNLPNRNVIRWFAVNEFLYSKYNRKLKFHIIGEHKAGGEKISGRYIRQEIVDNNLHIPGSAAQLLPTSTIQILEEEIQKGNIPGERDLETIINRFNRYSRTKLLNIAHFNADAVEQIIRGRRFNRENQIWASLRKAGYGPVLTRLAISCLEKEVIRDEVYQLIKLYQEKGIIPPDQRVEKVVERAWYLSSQLERGMSLSHSHKLFRTGETIKKPPLYKVDAGLHLRSFEVPSVKTGMEAGLYVDKRGFLCAEIRTLDRKIKSPLKLPAEQATYLRLLVDSHFIPLKGEVLKKKEGLRIRIHIQS